MQKEWMVALNLKYHETVATDILVNSGDVGGLRFNFEISDDQTRITDFSGFSKLSYIARKSNGDIREGIVNKTATPFYEPTKYDIDEPGLVIAGVALYSSDFRRVTTLYFSFRVTADILPGIDRIRGGDQFDSLTTSVLEAEQMAREARRILEEMQGESFVTYETFNTALDNKAGKNFVINGDFTIWQRGEHFVFSGTEASGLFTADRMQIVAPPGTRVNREGKGTKGNCLKIDIVSNEYVIWFPYRFEREEWLALSNKTVTVSIEASATSNIQAANVWFVSGQSPFEYIGEPSFIITPTRQRFSTRVRFGDLTDFNEASDHVQLFRQATTNWTGSVRIHNVKIELGDRATPFVPRLPGEELALCQRYYKEGAIVGAIGDTGNSDTFWYTYSYDEMRVVPTIAMTNPRISLFWGELVSGFTFHASADKRHARITANKTSHGLDINTVRFGATIMLDAEI